MEPIGDSFSAPTLSASQIISAAAQLRTSIDGYRTAIEREQREQAQQADTEDMPF